MSQTAAVEVIYRSHVSVEPKPGGIKLVSLPEESAPVPMGLHGPIAKHYKLAEGTYTPHASTLDYVVGATAGCLAGTLGRGGTSGGARRICPSRRGWPHHEQCAYSDPSREDVSHFLGSSSAISIHSVRGSLYFPQFAQKRSCRHRNNSPPDRNA